MIEMEKDQTVTFRLAPDVAQKSRSMRRRLEDHFDAIEGYLRQGVRRDVILAHLNTMGFNMKLSGFDTALKRIRRDRKNAKLPTPPPETKSASTLPRPASRSPSPTPPATSFNYSPTSDTEWTRPKPEKESP